jgi:hypothetical protein
MRTLGDIEFNYLFLRDLILDFAEDVGHAFRLEMTAVL